MKSSREEKANEIMKDLNLMEFYKIIQSEKVRKIIVLISMVLGLVISLIGYFYLKNTIVWFCGMQIFIIFLFISLLIKIKI